MSVYLTHYHTASTEYQEAMTDAYYPQRVHWFPDTYARVHTGMFYVPHLLANKVLDTELVTWLKNTPVQGKTAFILAGGSQAWAGGKTQNPNPTRLTYKYKFPMLTLTQIYAGKTAALCGAYDYVTTDASACASSLKVLTDAQVLIETQGFDRVIILTLEDAVADLTLEFFGITDACNTIKKEEETGIKPSAFDATNAGFIVGQGAAFAVLHSERAVQQLGLQPKAILKGAAIGGEVNDNPLGQSKDGKGYQSAILGAIEKAQVQAADITIVKTHGTGTPVNNQSEGTAIRTVLKDFVATSYKQRIGHTVAASGLLETCLILNDIRTGQIPEILNRTEDDAVFLSKPATAPDGLLLSLAAGMGNIYAAAIFDVRV